MSAPFFVYLHALEVRRVSGHRSSDEQQKTGDGNNDGMFWGEPTKNI